MIDLADIRKKAQKDKGDQDPVGKDTPCADPTSVASGDMGLQEKDSSNAVQGVPAARSEPRSPQVQVAESVRNSADEAVTEADPLERLFAQIDDSRLATEEVYFKGLGTGGDQGSEARREWLTFSLGNEEYALDIEGVVEIIKPRSISPIPRVPGFILGIMSLRGVILPVFDLKQRLKLGQVAEDPANRVVVCQVGDRIAGLLVDNISQVVRLAERNIEPPPSLMPDLDVELVAGVGRYQGHFLILLNLGGILAAEYFGG
ncbi:MAG: chemotaxis protein CheW [Geoalkalibacter sp.]|jgi:purine-binding chemotaxis protein CheW|uniref:chemotaxis protein CheW n=1 Tax=Geoalkalibacter sp. TaxID=3041440 RepID=UPI002A9A7A8D|nr:chemotaxis protein CheW [Thermodesulfobacteriota bacterium]